MTMFALVYKYQVMTKTMFTPVSKGLDMALLASIYKGPETYDHVLYIKG